jgi:hypothetical protein
MGLNKDKQLDKERINKMNDFRNYKKTYILDNVENLQEIADNIKKLLEGKKYLWVDAYEYKRWRPEIRTDQIMKNVRVWYQESTTPPTYGGFSVNDSYGVWGMTTTKQWRDSISFFANGIEMNLHTPEGREAWWQIYILEDQE